jgi:hypothetical protein
MDAARLAVYFGTGFLDGFLAGSSMSGYIGGVKHGGSQMVTFASELGRSANSSLLKRAVDEDASFALNVWFVKVTIDKHGKGEWDADWFGGLTSIVSLSVSAATATPVLFAYEQSQRSGVEGLQEWQKRVAVDVEDTDDPKAMGPWNLERGVKRGVEHVGLAVKAGAGAFGGGKALGLYNLANRAMDTFANADGLRGHMATGAAATAGAKSGLEDLLKRR